MSKGIIDYIPKRELELQRFNLDTFIILTPFMLRATVLSRGVCCQDLQHYT